MWLRQQSQELLETWLRHSPAMYFVIDSDRKILWSNQALSEWSNYTPSELRGSVLERLAVSDSVMVAEQLELKEIVDGYADSYCSQRQLSPKNGKPEWGDLTVIRYPATGPIECFLCHWTPLKNGTAAAFNLAMERTTESVTAMTQLAAKVDALSKTDEDEEFVIRALRAARRHPKLALLILSTVVAAPAMNQGRELLLWLLGIEQPADHLIQQAEPTAGETPPATQIAARRFRPQRDADMIVTGANGLQIEWHREQGVQPKWPSAKTY